MNTTPEDKWGTWIGIFILVGIPLIMVTVSPFLPDTNAQYKIPPTDEAVAEYIRERDAFGDKDKVCDDAIEAKYPELKDVGTVILDIQMEICPSAPLPPHNSEFYRGKYYKGESDA